MLDQALEALKTYDWGVEPKVLSPIDDAVVASHGDQAARRDLEQRLVVLLTPDVPRAARDYICRKLMQVASGASIPTLATFLPRKEDSHMARYALERISDSEAGDALRNAVTQVDDDLKIGMISSLGARGEDESVAILVQMLDYPNPAVARSAALALGAIRSPAAAQALTAANPAEESVKQAVTDASFACAETFLKAGNKGEALKIYKSLARADQPKHVRLGATRGVLACAGS